ERALMTARLRSLDDERVGARCGRDLRLLRSCDRAPDGDSVAAQARDDGTVRAAEGERDRGRRGVCDELELRLPLVVAPARLSARDAVALGLSSEALRIVGECGLVDRQPGREEEVDPERSPRARPHLLELLPNGGGRPVAGGDE